MQSKQHNDGGKALHSLGAPTLTDPSPLVSKCVSVFCLCPSQQSNEVPQMSANRFCSSTKSFEIPTEIGWCQYLLSVGHE